MASIHPELVAAAAELDIDLRTEPTLQSVVADMLDPLSMPSGGWTAHYDVASKRRVYRNDVTGITSWEHPQIAYYRGVVFMERGGLAQMMENIDSDPPSEADIAAMADYVGVEPHEDEAIQEVALLMCCAPLPDGFVELERSNGSAVFRHTGTGVESEDHPLDAYFKELLRRRRMLLSTAAAGGVLQGPHALPPSGVDIHGLLPRPAAHTADTSGESAPTKHNGSGDSIARQSEAVAAPLAPALAAQQDSPAARSSATLPEGLPDLAQLLARVELVKRAAGSHPSRRAAGVAEDVGGPRDVTSVLRRALSFGDVETLLSTCDHRSLTNIDERKPGDDAVRRENICVAVRCKPVSTDARNPSAWVAHTTDRRITLAPNVDVRNPAHLQDVQHRGNKSHTQDYTYDMVFDERASTRQVYQNAAQAVVLSALDGVNAAVMAYGQTGSGKTYTMIGDNVSVGLLTMALMDVFTEMNARSEHAVYRVTASLLEIYNESIQDLFAEEGPVFPFKEKQNIVIQEDTKRNVTVVSPLTEVAVTDMGAIVSTLRDALRKRHVASTAMNEYSSRSHTIFNLNFVIQDKGAAGRGRMRYSTLTFVDLAGSERLAKSGASGKSAAESAHINLSLLMLGNVIAKLADGRKRAWLPFRNSKLTRLLQSNLGGNARCVVIATIDPGLAQAEETASTLRFAARAMQVENKVQVNETMSRAALRTRIGKQLDSLMGPLHQRTIRQLEIQIELLRGQVATYGADKARLMDRLEQVTGVPLGDLDAPIDVFPKAIKGVALPAGNGFRKADEDLDARKALGSIVRMADAGTSRMLGEVARRGRNYLATPGEAMAAARRLRSERDALRRKLLELLPRLSVSSKFRSAQELLDHLEKLVGNLEDLIGGRNPECSGNVLERMDEVIGAVAIVNSELRSLQRQHTSLQFLLRSAEQRLASAGRDDPSLVRENAELRRRLRDWAGVAMPSLPGDGPEAGPSAADAAIADADDARYPSLGNASVRIARVERVRAQRLQKQLDALTSERDTLRQKLEDVGDELADMRATAADRGVEPDAAATTNAPLYSADTVRQLRTRANVLVKELAVLAKERDLLLDFMLGQSGGSLPPQEIINKVFAERHASAVPVRSRVSAEAPACLAVPAAGRESMDVHRSNDEKARAPVPIAARPDFDSKPVAAEVTTVLQRSVDRQLKGHLRRSMGKSGNLAAPVGDYDAGSRPDATTTEIASLKRRLVQSERKRVELATQVAAERRAVQLQVHNAKRIETMMTSLSDQMKATEAVLHEKDAEAKQMRMERDAALLELNAMRKISKDHLTRA